jgi:hypothetical protein
MTETLKFPRKSKRALPALAGTLISAAALAACGSRFTANEHAASAGSTSANGGSVSTAAGGDAGRVSGSAGQSNRAGSGGAPSAGGAPAQAGSDAGSGHGGSNTSSGGVSGVAGSVIPTGGTFTGSGGALVAVAGVGGVGGSIATAGIGGIGVMTGGSGNWSPCTPLTMIDDMEDGNDRNCPNQGRNGEWWASTGTTTGTTEPAKTGEFPAYPLGADARTHSNYGMRLSGKGFGHTDADWASIGFNLVDENSYDLTPYQGLAFFAKSRAGTITVHVEFATDSTTASAEGGACTTKCNDHWSKSVSVDGTWREFMIPFSSLAQEGWGVQPKDLAHARFVFFGFLGTDNGPAAFEYLIDDVRLY